MNYETLPAGLIRAVPELKRQIEELRPSEGPTKPYVVFEDVLLPYMLIELESGDPDLVLQRIFDFLEGTAGHGDQRVRNVVGATIFEYLSGHRFLARASKYMGPASRRLAGQIAIAWGHGLPSSDRTYERIDEDWYANRVKEEVAKLGHAGIASPQCCKSWRVAPAVSMPSYAVSATFF